MDIIQPLSETCEEISSDALTVRGFQENECRDYHLGERDQGSGSCYFLHLDLPPSTQAVQLAISGQASYVKNEGIEGERDYRTCLSFHSRRERKR